MLSLELLGNFRLAQNEQEEILLSSKKARALLCFLALSHRHRVSREKLASLLWHDRFDEQARHSLRQCVLSVRKAIEGAGDNILISDGDDLFLSTDVIHTDVAEFERLVGSGDEKDLEAAVGIYRGDLLDGFQTRSEGFDDWLALERARLRALAVEAHWCLAESFATAKRFEDAIRIGQRLLEIDIAHEAGHRLLMQLYQKTGRQAAALHQFQLCEDSLSRHLDVEPSPETRELFEAIRLGETPDFEPFAGGRLPGAAPIARPKFSRKQFTVAAAVLLLAILISGAATWVWLGRESVEPVDLTRMRFPLPVKPSIAVLPFHNVSGDEADDIFIDSITEEINSALSIVSEMFVISHTTAQTYNGKAISTRQVAEELGVRYILDGSVQHVGNQVRIRVQLVDAVAGYVVWADSFDRELGDVFALQDDITLRVVTALQVKITEGEQDRITLIHGTKDLAAWIKVGEALRHLRRLTRYDLARASELYSQALDLDPGYAKAWAGLAWAHLLNVRFGWARANHESILIAAESAKTALELDPERPLTHSLLGTIELMRGNHDQAVTLAEKAVALNPSGADVAAILGWILSYSGNYERSIFMIRSAMRLSPYYADWYRWVLGRSYRLAGQVKNAIGVLGRSPDDTPQSLAPDVELATAYSQIGDLAEARKSVERVLEIDPDFSARAWTTMPPYFSQVIADKDLLLLRRAGFPE